MDLYFVPLGRGPYTIVDKDFKLIHDYQDAHESLSQGGRGNIKNFTHMQISTIEDMSKKFEIMGFAYDTMRKDNFEKWQKQYVIDSKTLKKLEEWTSD